MSDWIQDQPGHAIYSSVKRVGKFLGIFEAYRVTEDPEQEAHNKRFTDQVHAIQLLGGGHDATWYGLDDLEGRWIVIFRPYGGG